MPAVEQGSSALSWSQLGPLGAQGPRKDRRGVPARGTSETTLDPLIKAAIKTASPGCAEVCIADLEPLRFANDEK